jgi:uncharacterized Tic20 family protein
VVDAPPPPYGGSAGATAGPPPGAAPAASAASRARTTHAWAAACHLVGLIDFGLDFLLVGLIASLVVWLIRKDEDPEVDFHGKEAINFQLNVLLAWIAGLLLSICVVPALLLPLLWIASLVLTLIAGVRAANGERWRYPTVLRILR